MAAGFSVVCGAGACGYRARMKHGRPVWARARVAAVLSASRGSVSWLGRGYPRACWGLPPAPPCTHSLLSPILGRLESALSWISCGFEVIEPAAFFFFFFVCKDSSNNSNAYFTRLLDVLRGNAPGRQHAIFALNFPGYTDPVTCPRVYC